MRRARRRLDLLVLDRYWHDVIVDLSAGGEMAKPPRLLTLLIPRPDRVLVLELPEEEAIVASPTRWTSPTCGTGASCMASSPNSPMRRS